jgi:phage tail-like protein
MPESPSPLVATLPEVFRVAIDSSPPLAALVAAADGMQSPVTAILDTLDRIVDPARTPEQLIAYLSSWVDLDWLTVPDAQIVSRPALAGGSAPLRDLILESADLAARRGTPAGLVRFLELATGVRGYRVEDVPGQFHVLVHLPAAAVPQEATVERIVQALKPAHVTAEVVPAQLPPGASTQPPSTQPPSPQEEA